MARPRKPKQCQFAPLDTVFKPRSIPMYELEQVVLPVELMEAVRLCDLEGLDQLEAGRRMGVSRGTVQRYVKDARRRIADALVHAKALVLESPPAGEARHPAKKRSP
ncbi:MAG: DUF134 domain-containing protein [Pseudomonadota bacterium]